MDNKDVKRLLKEAKEAVKDKDFKTALRLSKAALKEDRNNYAALILLGRALQESDQKDQAPNAYRKAAELQPNQALAWQGLASYYEKVGGEDGENELLSVYEHLLPLETSPEKRGDIADKIANIALRKKNSSVCINVLKKLNDISEDTKGIRRSLLKTLLQFKELPEPENIELESTVEQFLADWKASGLPTDSDIKESYRRYLKSLYRRKDLQRLIQEALVMIEHFPADIYPREWLCKVFAESVVDEDSIPRETVAELDAAISGHIDHVLKVSSESKVALHARSVLRYKNGDIVTARDELVRASVIPPNSWQLWLLLAELQLELGLMDETASSAAEASLILAKLSGSYSRHLKRATLVEATARSHMKRSEDWEKALTLSQEVLKTDPTNGTAISGIARTMINRKELSEALKWVRKLDPDGPHWETAAVLRSQCLAEEGDAELEKRTENATSLLWLEIARRASQKGQESETLAALRQAAKRGPLNYEIFLRLGNYYGKQPGPTAAEKARRCYQEAFRMNPWSDEVGEKLSDTLRLLNDTDGNRQFLESVTRSGDSCWAWLRLGLLHADTGNTEASIICLCKAVSKDPSNSRSWESLADAYCLRGSWTSALKSYQHVIELEPTSLYSKYRIAFVKFTLGLYEEALTEFRDLVSSAESFVPALHGLGETCLSEARKLFSEHRLGACHDRLQEAVDALSRASACSRLSCIWKLLGDACFLASQFPSPLNRLSVPSNVTQLATQEASTEGVGVEKLEGEQLLKLAARLYCRAMPKNLESSLLWHDLAMTYHRHASLSSDKACQQSLQQQALNAARRAVSVSPSNAQHWNLLGVIAASEGLRKFALAQHAFIKAVKIDMNYATAWTNLGAIYFLLGYLKLANKAFAAGMRAEPEYTNSWIGQGLVAERLQPEEAIDLFRHAAVLPFHQEAAVGYAHHVLQTVLSAKRNDPDYKYCIERMHAVPVATDCLEWYTGRIQKDVCGWNMFGLLLERMNLLRPAELAYRRALDVLGKDSQDSQDSQRDSVITNLGRTLIAAGKAEEAVGILQEARKASFSSQCTLALAFYKAKQFRESYGAYETCLHWMAGDDGLKAHILVAMAASMYTFDRVDDAKTLLYQSVTMRPVSIHALLAMCALGILQQDLALTVTALRELLPHRDDPEFLHHIAIFDAYTVYLKGDVKGCLRILCSAIHRHPSNAALWLALAQVQFDLPDGGESSVKAAGNTAYAALVHGRSTMDVSKVLSLVTLAELLAGNGRKSLVRGQQAVHQSPDVAENWIVLVGSLMSKPHQDFRWLRQLTTHIRRRLETTSSALNAWLSKSERVIDSKLAQA